MAGPYCFVVPLARPTGLRSSCHVISPSGMSGSSKDVLTSSHHRSYVSQSGLAAILKSIKENGLPKGTSRSSIKRARDEALPAELFTTVQLEMDDGTLKQFPCVQPILLIKHLIEVVPSFADFFFGKLLQHQNDQGHKWKLCIYSDEILPGNIIKPRNERKLVTLYYSFCEFDSALGCEDLWFVLCTIRSNLVKKIKSGWSQVFRVMGELFFRAPYNIGLGVMIHNERLGSHLFFGIIGLLIGDEQAVKNCWASKGASGLFPCFFCKNATLHSLSLWQTDSTNYLQSHCQLDVNKLQFQSDNSLRSAVQHLKNRHGTVSKEAFARIEKSLGLNYAPAGALQSDTFWGLLDGGPISVTQYDYMHTLLVSGAWNTETGMLFQVLKDHISCKTADDFVRKFVWPIQWESRSATGKRCLEKHTADGGEVKASASEGLGVYPVIRLLLMEASLC